MIVAEIQVHRSVRRPVSADTFLATEYEEQDQAVHVRGNWRGHPEERTYRFPLASIVAVRIITEGPA